MPPDDTNEVFPLTPPPLVFNEESSSHFNALAGLTIPERLPSLPAYLRARYAMPPAAAAQLTEYFGYLTDKYGIENVDEIDAPKAKRPRSALDDERPAV